MRVTLDTNVLVSAFISKYGHSADILDLIATFEEITLVLSEEILEEFTDVMGREEVKTRFRYTMGDVSRYKSGISGIAEIVKVRSSFKAVKDDPEDDIVVNTALDGMADYIVSGDRHLMKLRRFKGVRIVGPSAFMAIVTKGFGELIIPKSEFE